MIPISKLIGQIKTFTTMSLFSNSGVELQNSWTATGKEEKLTASEKENITNAVIRHNDVMIDGEKVHFINVVFAFKNGKAKSYKLSALNEQFPNGTKVNVDSVVMQEIMDENGVTAVRVACKAAK